MSAGPTNLLNGVRTRDAYVSKKKEVNVKEEVWERPNEPIVDFAPLAIHIYVEIHVCIS